MSLATEKGITVASGFILHAQKPLDARVLAETIADRDWLVTNKAAYKGLRVYVEDTKKEYRYNGIGWDDVDAYATPTSGGQMSPEDKKKLDTVEKNAQENVIESIKLNGVALTPTEKSVNLEVLVAEDLANYYNKNQIDQKITAIPKFAIEVVDALPTENISETTVYLLKSGEESQNLYTEYIRAAGKWEILGTQTLDLSNYVTKDNAIASAEAKDATTITFTRADGTTFDVTITGTVYQHPSTHPASMITEDAMHRFVSDTEKAAWNAKPEIFFGKELPESAPAGSICFLIESEATA